MVDRMVRAARADVALYEQVEATPSLTTEAYTIVGIVALVNVIGGLFAGMFFGEGGALVSAIWAGISTFIGYFVWAFLTYWIGTSVFNGTANFGELQRTIGYAYTPLILGFIPCINILAFFWSLYLGIVAVRQALDFDTGKALLTAGGALLVWFIINLIISSVLGLGALGFGAITG